LSSRSALDAVSLAFDHAKAQLWPLRWPVWWRLALLGLATGELGTFGCGGSGVPSSVTDTADTSAWPAGPPWGNGAELIAILIASVALIAVVVAVIVAFTYINSICRFILIDTVASRAPIRITVGWRKWRTVGRRFFLWQLALQGVFAAVAVVAVGTIAAAFSLLAASGRVGLMIVAGLAIAPLFLSALVAGICAFVLGKDVMAPVLAIEQAGVVSAWRRAAAIIRADAWGFVGYLFVKLVLSIMAGIAMFLCLMLLLLPVAIGGAVVFVGRDVVWSPGTIIAVGMVGAIIGLWVAAAFLLLNAPAALFFPAYGLHFLAARYPPLDAWLNPPIGTPASPLPPRNFEPGTDGATA
jgi:hypothetical protein